MTSTLAAVWLYCCRMLSWWMFDMDGIPKTSLQQEKGCKRPLRKILQGLFVLNGLRSFDKTGPFLRPSQNQFYFTTITNLKTTTAAPKMPFYFWPLMIRLCHGLCWLEWCLRNSIHIKHSSGQGSAPVKPNSGQNHRSLKKFVKKSPVIGLNLYLHNTLNFFSKKIL